MTPTFITADVAAELFGIHPDEICEMGYRIYPVGYVTDGSAWFDSYANGIFIGPKRENEAILP